MPRKSAKKTAPTAQDLLLASLPFTAESGFSARALAEGGATLGLSEADAQAFFPHLPDDLLTAYARWADETMLDACPPARLEPLKIREKIATLVMVRLALIAPYKAAEARAVRTLAHPRHARLATRLMQHTVDAMWVAAGDTSTDYNFYTKRMLLAGVYGSTLLYWLRDTSDEASATQAFLAKRIDNVLTFGSAQRKVTSTAARAASFIGQKLGFPHCTN